MSETIISGEIVHKNAANLSIELERGQRGGYGWSIKCYGDDPSDIILKIGLIDKTLRDEYLNGGQPEGK